MSSSRKSRFFRFKRKNVSVLSSLPSKVSKDANGPSSVSNSPTNTSIRNPSPASQLKQKLTSFSNDKGESSTTPAEPVKRKLTPLEEQVISLKDQHPGILLMVECGYRYRFFGDDASAAAKVLDISAHQDGHGTGHFLTASVPTLTGPDRYIRRLVFAGHKVGIVSQTETAAEKKVSSSSSSKGPFDRQLTAVYTASTLLGLGLADFNLDESGWILAVVEGHGEVAIAGSHPLSGDVLYDVFSDDQPQRNNLDQRMVLIQPKEIVICGEKMAAKSREILYRFIREREDGQPGRLEELPASKFEGTIDALTCEASESSLAKLWPEFSSLLTQSFTGLYRHLKEFGLEKSLTMSTNVKRFTQSDSNNRLRLPALTVRNLELFKKDGLFSILNKTLSKFGSRMLKSWVSGPLLNKSLINQRLDAVQYFIDNPEVCKKCREMLRGLPDLELAVMSVINLKIRTKDFCKTLLAIDNVSKKLSKVWRDEPKVPLMIEDVVASITKSFKQNNQVLSQINVDQADSYQHILKSWKDYPKVCERLEEISALELGLDKHKTTICRALGWLMFNYSTVSDQEYLIEVKVKDAKSVPHSWTKVSATKQVVRFRTEFILESLPKLQYARERLDQACNRAWTSFLSDNLDNFRLILIGIRSLAKLDALLALATVSAQDGFCRPVFSDDREMVVENGRNIVVESALSGRPDAQYVPNDVKMDSNERALILTGPNMGGKSCYLRQIAMCALMAQTGFFVPASAAKLPIFDGIYIRIGARDDMWTGRSTLMVELEEAALMMNEATDRSLVLIDELGRGTSTHDGTAIAKAVLRHFVYNVQSLTVFVTHYKVLTAGDWVTQNLAKNGHMSYHTLDRDQVLFLYKLTDGPCANSFGINVAEMSGLPAPILRLASDMAAQFESTA